MESLSESDSFGMKEGELSPMRKANSGQFFTSDDGLSNESGVEGERKDFLLIYSKQP